jgi:AraC-like DNA-binding protein
MQSTADATHKRFSVAHARDGSPALAAQVPALSVLRIDAAAGGSHTSVPHDLYTLTVYCDERLACRTAGEGRALRAVVSALRSRSAVFTAQGSGQIAVAQLTPLGWLRSFGFPLTGLTDARIEMRDLQSSQAEAALHRTLLDAPNDQARCEALGHWLETRITERRRLGLQAERVAAVAMCMLEGEPEEMEPLARRHGVSRRQLERDFRHWLGVSPRAYSRLVRFQRSVRALADGIPPALVAADQAYADQAHMTRAFRDTAGLTPGQVRTAIRDADRRDGGALRRSLAGRTIVLPHRAHEPEAMAA